MVLAMTVVISLGHLKLGYTHWHWPLFGVASVYRSYSLCILLKFCTAPQALRVDFPTYIFKAERLRRLKGLPFHYWFQTAATNLQFIVMWSHTYLMWFTLYYRLCKLVVISSIVWSGFCTSKIHTACFRGGAKSLVFHMTYFASFKGYPELENLIWWLLNSQS
jgi:hypothetical protein